jgi:hypothetical protein
MRDGRVGAVDVGAKGRGSGVTGARTLRRRGLVTAALLAAAACVAPAAWGNEEIRTEASGMKLVSRLPTGAGGDIAFWGEHAFVVGGALDGKPENDDFTVIDISEPEQPRLVSQLQCHGSANDIGVWGDIVILSVDVGTGAGPACQAQGSAPAPFLGLRVISVADPARPVWVADVSTENGSHTNTLLPDLDPHDGTPEPRLLVYANNGYSPPMTSADPRGLETVVEIPLDAPDQAHALEEAALPYSPALGQVPPEVAPGSGSFNTLPNLGCHDLSILTSRRLAACSGLQPDTQLWDLTDPVRPVLLSVITNPAIEHHHSTGFSWDGRTLVLVEESLTNHVGGRCGTGGQPGSPKGALWFYDISNPRLPILRSWFQAPQPSRGYCTPHYFNVLPLKDGRDVLVASWGGAGTAVVDFTDPASPQSLGYFTVLSDSPSEQSFPYASYWYAGHIYANNGEGVLGPLVHIGGDRGLDVLRLDEDLDAVALQGFSHGTQDCRPATRRGCQELSQPGG